MKEIVIISGKGGTGKTTFASSFAYLASDESVIADCDVDAADMHLLLEPKISEIKNFYSGFYAQINTDKCIKCNKCEEVCRFNAIIKLNKEMQVDKLNCEGCGYCFEVCPAKAIELKENKTGKIITSVSRFNTNFVYGKLNTGAENSGKLVAEVKEKAKKLAGYLRKEIIIVDGSPGIGCPVISSISGASLVVIVTEPTVSGIHDLHRIIKVVERFKIPAVCIINKYNINEIHSYEIQNYLTSKNIDVVGKITYSEIFSEAIINGKTVAEYSQNKLKHEIEEIWNLIKHKIEEN